MRTTVGQLLVNRVLPKELRDYRRELNKKEITRLLREVAEKYPDRYVEISHNLAKIGLEAAYTSGGNSFGLRHLRKAKAAKQLEQKLRQRLSAILSDKTLTPEERNRKIVLEVGKHSDQLQDAVYRESLEEGNPLAYQVLSGSRGNPMNLSSLRGADLLYVDHHNRTLPIPVLRSYSQGLTPLEYWAGTYGARKGVVDVKMATQRAGFLSKQLTQIAHRGVVTAFDADKDSEVLRGLPADTADDDNEGALLAKAAGGYPRNTILTPKILSDLNRQGIKKILVRSPIVGGPPDGGLYSRDVGVREQSRLPEVGESVLGIAAAQAISEPISQSQLCLARGTRVRMADWSCKPIEDISPGDWVLGANKQGWTFPVRVSRVFANGLRECYRTIFSHPHRPGHHATLFSTPDHKVLLRRQSEVDVLPVGSFPSEDLYAVQPGPFVDEQADLVREPLALLLGLAARAQCRQELPEEETRNESIPVAANCSANATPCCQVVAKQVPVVETSFEENPHWLESLHREGLLCGEGSEQQLSASVFRWDNESVAELLAGIYASDEQFYISRRHHTQTQGPFISFGSESLSLLSQIISLLRWRFGIIADPPSQAICGAWSRPIFYTLITDENSLWRFCILIPLYGARAQGSRKLLSKWLIKNPDPYEGIPRISHEPVGKLETFDIEVDHPDHLFVLENGLIVSNSSKHSSGVAGASSNRAVSGFDYINQLVQVPKHFKEGAAHAKVDGLVQRIEDAPAGGKYVWIEGEKHYVGRGFDVRVKKGDKVEAGDVISDGIPNPAEVVKHKGIGEGRRYFTEVFRKALQEAGIKAHRRNIELLARGAVNHIRLTDEIGDFVPDDVVPYSALEAKWKPRPDHRRVPVRQALGKYLERPYLHYSIGDKIRPSMLQNFEEFGIKDVEVHDEPPPFVPEMVRGMANIQHDPDWMVRMLGSGQKKSLLTAARRGGTSQEQSTSYVPSLAKGVNFNRTPPFISKASPVAKFSQAARARLDRVKQAQNPTITPAAARRLLELYRLMGQAGRRYEVPEELRPYLADTRRAATNDALDDNISFVADSAFVPTGGHPTIDRGGLSPEAWKYYRSRISPLKGDPQSYFLPELGPATRAYNSRLRKAPGSPFYDLNPQILEEALKELEGEGSPGSWLKKNPGLEEDPEIQRLMREIQTDSLVDEANQAAGRVLLQSYAKHIPPELKPRIADTETPLSFFSEPLADLLAGRPRGRGMEAVQRMADTYRQYLSGELSLADLKRALDQEAMQAGFIREPLPIDTASLQAKLQARLQGIERGTARDEAWAAADPQQRSQLEQQWAMEDREKALSPSQPGQFSTDRRVFADQAWQAAIADAAKQLQVPLTPDEKEVLSGMGSVLAEAYATGKIQDPEQLRQAMLSEQKNAAFWLASRQKRRLDYALRQGKITPEQYQAQVQRLQQLGSAWRPGDSIDKPNRFDLVSDQFVQSRLRKLQSGSSEPKMAPETPQPLAEAPVQPAAPAAPVQPEAPTTASTTPPAQPAAPVQPAAPAAPATPKPQGPSIVASDPGTFRSRLSRQWQQPQGGLLSLASNAIKMNPQLTRSLTRAAGPFGAGVLGLAVSPQDVFTLLRGPERQSVTPQRNPQPSQPRPTAATPQPTPATPRPAPEQVSQLKPANPPRAVKSKTTTPV